jgi:hypothetical protein
MADRLDHGSWGEIQGVSFQVFVADPSKLYDLVALSVYLFGFPSHHTLTADAYSRVVHFILIYPGFALSIEAVVARPGAAAQPEIILSGSIAGSRTLVEYRYGREYLLAEAPGCTVNTIDTSGTRDTGACLVDIGLAAKDLGLAATGDYSRMNAELDFAVTIIGDNLAAFTPGWP